MNHAERVERSELRAAGKRLALSSILDSRTSTFRFGRARPLLSQRQSQKQTCVLKAGCLRSHDLKQEHKRSFGLRIVIRDVKPLAAIRNGYISVTRGRGRAVNRDDRPAAG